MSNDKFDELKNIYVQTLKPLFFPKNLGEYDIISYFASLLRVVGMEDKGWDPYSESKGVLNDINRFFNIDLPKETSQRKIS